APVRPPLHTFAAVPAIPPVAGMPPKNADATDASPWPTSSRSASYGPVSEIEAATRADSGDSMAARAATVSAGPRSGETASQLSVGTTGPGIPVGSSPIVVTGN